MNDEDVEEYILKFKRIAALNGWRREQWSLQLDPYLRGKSRVAYNSVSMEEV